MVFRDPRGFGRRPAPGRVAETPSLFGAEASGEQGVTVSAYVAELNGALRWSVPETWVRGEVGEWRPWSSGHVYFTLKDEAACLNGMMWAEDAARVPFRVEAGMVVLARGRSNVYPRSGKLTFVASDVQPYGVGALQLAFEQLKARLQAEGLFDAAKKRALPLLPRCIGLVSSRRGAAVRDVLKVLRARFPNAHVTIYPVAVQGPHAAEEIARAVRAFSRVGSTDVVIVARGGGSAEDLAAFNDERVVRAVAACSVPTIAAVGHEVDVTLTDLAADVRAATPSQAAELVVQRREELVRELAAGRRALAGALRERLETARADLADLAGAAGLGGFPARVERGRLETDGVRAALFASVRALPAAYGERLARAEQRVAAWPARAALGYLMKDVAARTRALTEGMSARLLRAKERLGGASGRLAALDPLSILARGYAVAYKAGVSAPLLAAGDVSAGDDLRILLARGEVDARVTGTRPDGGIARRAGVEPDER
jgi:exodeoxyribonuclease VII large subunit